MANLADWTEVELLEVVLKIFSKPEQNISVFDHMELNQINQEFNRRGQSDKIAVY